MSELNRKNALIALLTHAPNDLTVLYSALAQIPDDFAQTIGINIQTLESEAQMSELLNLQLTSARIIVLRILGRLGSVPGFPEVTKTAYTVRGQHCVLLAAWVSQILNWRQLQQYQSTYCIRYSPIFKLAAVSIWRNCCVTFPGKTGMNVLPV